MHCRLAILAIALVVSAAVCPNTMAQGKSSPARESFVPVGEMEAIFQRSPNGVVLPRAEFQELMKKAQANQSSNSLAPAAILIRSAVYKVRQADKHCVINLAVDIEQFSDDWQIIDLPIGNLLVEKASIEDSPAVVAPAENQPGTLMLLHKTSGRFTLNLTLSTPLGTVGSDRVAAFKVIPTAAATIEVTCPKNRQLRFNNLKLTRPAPIEEEAVYSIPGGTDNQARLKWTTQQQTSDSQTLVFARTDAQLRLSRDDIRWTSDTRVSVFGNAINQLAAKVPTALEVTSVESAGLESWKLEDDPEAAGFTRVILNYRQPFTEDRVIKLAAVTSIPDEVSTRLPTLQFVDVTSHTGRLYVQHEDRLRLIAEVGGGIRHLGTSSAAASVPRGEIFDYWLQEFSLSVAVKPRERELFAEVNSSLALNDTQATFSCTATIETLNAPLFELPLTLPKGWQISSVTDLNNVAVKWRTGQSEDTIVVEPNSTTPAGQLLSLIIKLNKTIDDPTEIQTLQLPVISADNTLLVGGTYDISSAPDLTVSPVEIEGLAPVGADNGKVLYETQGTSYSGKLTVLRKPVRLSSRAVIRSWMDTRQRTIDAVVTVDVLNGTTRSLQLQLPEDIGDEVRFSVTSITRVPGFDDQIVPANIAISEQTSEVVEPGIRSFNLTFDRRFVGAVTLKTVVQQARTEDTKLVAPFVRVAKAIRQHGLVVFDAYPEQQLTPTTEISQSGLAVADSGLVPAPDANTGRRTALVYRYIQPEYSLQLDEVRFDTVSVPSAVCESIANVSILNDTGKIQRSSTAIFRSTGVQTLRFALPEGEQSYLWSTMLDGEAIEVRRDADEYLVAIPNKANQPQHSLEILFESTAEADSLLGNTEQQSVSLSIDSGEGTASAIDVLKQTWELRYPANSILLNYDGAFHPVRGLEKPGWLQAVASFVRLPTQRDFSKRAIPVGLFLLALFVVTTLIVKRRWKSLAALCLVGIFAGFLLSSTTRYDSAKVAATAEPQANAADYDMAESADEAESMDLYGGTNLQYNGGVAGNEAIPNSEWGNVRFGRAGAGYGGGGQGGGGMGGGRMGAGGFGGGGAPSFGGGGGLGGGGAGSFNSFGAPQETQNLNGNVPGGQRGGRGLQLIAPSDAPIAGDPFSQDQQAAPDPFAEQPSQSQFNSVIPFPTEGQTAQPTGSARLSVRAAIANPQDFQGMMFQSIGANVDQSGLKVTVQPSSRISAVRIAVASLVLLICLMLSRSSLARKIGFIALGLLIATACVPLVPNQWQSAIDGLVVGIVGGTLLWLVLGIFRNAVGWFNCLCSCRCFNLFRRKPMKTAAILLLLVSMPAATSADEPTKKNTNDGPAVVLPYTPGQPALLADRVFLPRKEFLQLYQQAYPGTLARQNNANKSAVVAAFYESKELRQIKDTAWSQAFSVRFVIRSFTDEKSTVVLPIGNVAIRSAELDGSDAVLLATASTVSAPPVSSNANQTPVQQRQQLELIQQQVQARPAATKEPGYWVQVPKEGIHLLDVTFEVPVQLENSVGTLNLPVRSVATGVVTFELPDKSLVARINGRSNTFRTDNKTLTIPIANSNGLQIAWTPPATQAASDTIFHAKTDSALLLNDTGLVLKSTIAINSRQGQFAETQLKIPSDYSVQEVEGLDIAGWNLDEADKGLLIILFKQPVDSETTINLTLFQRTVLNTEETKVQIPVPEVVGASRDSGIVTVCAGRELEVRVDSLSGVSQINAADVALPNSVDKSSRKVLAWRYTRHPVSISVRAFRTAERLKVTTLSGVQLEPQRLLWTTLVAANISGAPRRRLEIVVPKDFLALSVDANDLADWYYSKSPDEDSDTKILNVQFTSARLGLTNTVIQGQTGRNQDDNSVQLVAPQITEADETSSTVSIWLDAASEIASASTGNWKRIGRETAIDSRILKLQSDSPDISVQTTSSDASAVSLTLRQAEAALGAESVTITTVTDTSIEMMLGLNWQISGAATRSASFTLPAEFSDVYDFKIPGLRQIDKVIEGDRVRFTIHLQRPASEKLFVLGTGTLPLPDSKQVSAMTPEFVVDESGGAKVSSQSHFWVIVNQSVGLLEAADLASDGNDVRAEEIRTKMPAELLQQSVAIRRLNASQPNSAWKLKFPKRQMVAPAVVALAAHVTVVASDSTWRSRHGLLLRNESRQFLPIILPDDSRILFCLVKGQPTRVVTRREGDQTLHLIPIPQSGEVAAPFEVQFGLAGQLPAISQNVTGDQLQIPCPVIPEYRDFPDYGVTISSNTWQVFLPSEWKAAIENDPRQTNVIAASADELSDTTILASVDNLKSIINAANTKGAKNVDQRIAAELFKQQEMLSSFGCVDVNAEKQRIQVLDEARKLSSKFQIQLSTPDYGAQDGGINAQAPTRGNYFLDNNELIQNGFNNRNSLNIIMDNSSDGIVLAEQDQLFNFILPESAEELKAVDKRSSGKAKPTQGKGSQRGQAIDSNGSQLLQRRESNKKSQSLRLLKESQGRRPAPESPAVPQAPSFGSRQRALPNQSVPSQQIQTLPIIEGFNSQNVIRQDWVPQAANQIGQIVIDGAESGLSAGGQFAVRRESQGLLSLDFQIPSDGTRYDFVRTGGNASLTLQVRNRDAVDLRFGICWIIACAIVAWFLLRGASHGTSSLLLRVLLFTAVAGIAGWLCTPNPIKDVSLAIGLIAVICACGIIIARSFWKSPQTA